MLCISDKLEMFLTGGVQVCTKSCAECTRVMYEDIGSGCVRRHGSGVTDARDGGKGG